MVNYLNSLFVLSLNFSVLGDATTLDGLEAPMSEDHTTYKFKIHHTGECPLKFWMNNPNTDQYNGIPID